MSSIGQVLRVAATIVGLIALSALIWFAGPLVAVADARPLDSPWVRGAVLLAVWLVAGGLALWGWLQRRQANERLEQALGAADEDESDADVLQDTMKDALSTLRRATGGRADYLYELPWYVIIGPPGSGKTTALVNSGLKFPLAKGLTPEAVAGVGGTRYCDWWFTEDAVLIDTAGRYTTQDSNPRGDHGSWLSFLELLKRNRPKQPINGVLVAISLEDLLTSGPDEIEAHAGAIRKRLIELHEHLRVDFPVYALFTKADLVAGFVEFFGQLGEGERRAVWGATFQTADKTRNMIGEVPAEFDALVQRLAEYVPDRLQEEPTAESRVAVFAFPSQMAALKRPLVDFMNRIFEPTRYHANATLRGFYFTSGTQQGTPIDQLIGAMSRGFGAEAGARAYSGRGKSFFLTDLLKDVVIGEAGWVSTNRAAVRRARALRIAAFAGVALASLGLAGAWWTSYSRNADLVARADAALADYRTVAAPALREVLIADRDFGKVLPLLHKLRHMPTGYAAKDEPTPVAATFGLSQRERLQSSSETAYQAGLERLFRSRLILRLEEQIEARRTDTSFLYEALKVYLMVGGRAPMDRELVLGWMRRDWAENIYPGAANARGRQALEEHLVAMLDMDLGREPTISLNGPLVLDAQRTLARMKLSERAYQLMKSQARGAGHKDWILSQRGGPDVGLVFETRTGEDLESVRVPYFFTYEGFQRAFIDRLPDIGEHLEREHWVLGEAGQQSAVQEQYATLFADLLKLYAGEFQAAWQGMLDKLRLRSLIADRPRYVSLNAAAAATSPIKQVLESIRDETRLTRERPADKDPKSAADAKSTADARMAAAGVLAPGAASSARIAADKAQRVGAAFGSGSPAPDRFGAPSDAPGANVEALFKPFHILVDGDFGKRPIDQLIQNLSEINQNLVLAGTNPAAVPQARAALDVQVATLRASAARFPSPIQDMLRKAAGEFEGDVTGVAVAQIGQALRDQVARVCQEVVTNRYPFAKGSAREVPIGDFARLFAPNGIMDTFFKEQLAPLVDTSKPVWAFKPDRPAARNLAPATLREFQRAAEIRDAFFPQGGNMPSVAIAVTPLSLAGDAAAAKLEVNGSTVMSQQGVNAPSSVMWPGPSGIGRTAISIQGKAGLFGSAPPPVGVSWDGVWSIYRMLDSGSVLKQGEALVVSHVVGGRDISYQLNVSSLQNPLTLKALQEFRCPASI